MVYDLEQGLSAIPQIGTGETLIKNQQQFSYDRKTVHDLVKRIALLMCYEEDFVRGKLAVRCVVGVAQVLHHDGPLEQAQDQGFPYHNFPSRGDGHKDRQVADLIQQSLWLDPSNNAKKRAPGENQQGEAHHGSVQAVAVVIELELFRPGMGQAAMMHRGGEGGEKTGRPFISGIGKGQMRHWLIPIWYRGF